MQLLKQSTAVSVTVLMVSSTDHIAGKTGLSAGLTIYATKAAGTPAAITPTVTELDSANVPGLYKLEFTTTHTNTLGELQLHITGSGADPTDVKFQVVVDLPGTAPSVAAIADAVWDELLSGHLGAGSAGEALDAAGTAGDPWTTLLPGAYGAGTAGKIIGDFIDAAISSRSTYAGGDTSGVTTLLARLTAIRAGLLDNLDDSISNVLAAIAAQSAPTANENADALLDRTAGVETNRTVRQAMRLILAALAGELSGAATTAVTIRDTNDTKNRIVATVDGNGNRSAITYDAS
jgi:hypothetical protein